jgi:hypothetical protein
MGWIRHCAFALAWLAFAALAMAAPYRGVVTYGGLPLPGATVTATQGTKTLTTVSDQDGAFQFNDLADGQWTIKVEMQLFATDQATVTIAPNMPAASFEMKLLPEGKIQAESQPSTQPIEIPPAPAPALTNRPASQQAEQPAQGNGNGNGQEMPKAPSEGNEQSADGFLVQGSVNNAATSQYATSPAFGNTRSGSRALYTGGFTATEENSALDARQFSLSGVPYPKPTFNNFTGVAVLQGPVLIPIVHRRGPNFSVSYQWTRNSSQVIETGLVPTQAEQSGNLAGLTNALGQPVTVYNPASGQPYANNQVPVSPQAAALLKLFPLPNIANVAGYNYQAPFLTDTHQDALNSRLDKALGRKDQFYGGFAFQSIRSNSVNLFDFVDQSGTLGITGNIHWTHRLKPRLFLFTGYTFSRLRTEVTPNFANHVNVSGAAGIGGNDQDTANWGPPGLNFTSGFAPMSDANSAFNRNRTDAGSASILYYLGKHNVSVGGDFRKQDYNDFSQQNPRGAFTFTGAETAGPGGTAASGSDLADFLIGVPDTSAIAYGNADKYFREPVISELFGRLVNLDISNGFAAVAPVVGNDPVGSLTGAHYPASLIRPDRRLISPRIGMSWRPIPASTVVIRAGYGIYPDTSVYQSIVLEMAQQAPLSKSVNVQNSAACPLTLANGFAPCSSVTSETFGIDPNFRIGYAQQWQLAVQRDLPFAMQMTATYMGIKGTHGPQEILPNSYPLGEANPCPNCPSGFTYETSNGNSIRNAGELQLRRRLRGGFAASVEYTYSKSIDDDAYLGGQGHTQGSSTQSANLTMPSGAVTQNWLDPRAERSLSSFDQRQLIYLQAQYTTGQGLEGGTLLGGWRGRALKEWTVQSNLTYGTGLPENPIYPAAVPGTGYAGTIRPDLTGAPIYGFGTVAHLNAAAYAPPAPGQWGTAGRNSITGPGQFSFTSQLARTFRLHGKMWLDVTVDSTNTFNHPTITSWVNDVESTQFGVPVGTNAPRSLQTHIHLGWQ